MSAPSDREAVARIIFDAFYDAEIDETAFNDPLYRNSRIAAEPAADAIIADHIAPRDAEIERLMAERDGLTVIVLSDDAKSLAEYEWERANKLAAERDALLAQLVTLREQLAAAEAARADVGRMPDAAAQTEDLHKKVWDVLWTKLSPNEDHGDCWIDGMDECADAIIADHIAPLAAEVSRLNAALSEERARVAGMRAALDDSQSLLVMIREIAPVDEGWREEDVPTLLQDQISANRAALTPEHPHDA